MCSEPRRHGRRPCPSAGTSAQDAGAAREFEALARQAREEKCSFEDYLHEVLTVEISSRRDSAVRQRIRDARFPETMTLDQFDFAASEGVDAAQVAELAWGGWIERAENVLLAIALGIEAAKQRRHVAFARAADLVRMLVGARDNRELGRTQRGLDRVDLLILDEVGFVPFDRAGGELLFNVIEPATSDGASSSPPTCPLPSGPRSSAATSSSPRHSWTASRTTPS